MIAFQSNRLCEKNSIAKIGDIQLAKVELMEMHLARLRNYLHLVLCCYEYLQLYTLFAYKHATSKSIVNDLCTASGV